MLPNLVNFQGREQSGVDQNPMPLFTLQILSELLMTEVEVIFDSTLIVALVTITLAILNSMP